MKPVFLILIASVVSSTSFSQPQTELHPNSRILYKQALEEQKKAIAKSEDFLKKVKGRKDTPTTFSSYMKFLEQDIKTNKFYSRMEYSPNNLALINLHTTLLQRSIASAKDKLDSSKRILVLECCVKIKKGKQCKAIEEVKDRLKKCEQFHK